MPLSFLRKLLPFSAAWLLVLFTAFNANSQTITITSPAGGEIWQICTQKTISWSFSNTTAQKQFNIDYSFDGSGNWSSIASFYAATGTNTGSFTWTVPNTPSSNVHVRVTDANNSATYGISNVFTIQTPLVLTSPVGGEQWQVGGPVRQVTWTSSTGSTYNLDYSTDNGVNWINFASNVSGSSYSWTIPNNPTQTARVRITDRTSSCISNSSPAPFAILAPTPALTLAGPSNAEIVYRQNNYTVSWTSAYVTNTQLKIELSTDGGSNWQTLTSTAFNGTGGGNYTWSVTQAPSTSARLRISDPITGTTGQSGLFTIAEPFLRITYPNGGETLNGCDLKNVLVLSGGTTGPYWYEYSLDAGSTWTTITTSTSLTTYNIQVPNSATNQARIRVTDNSGKAATDASDANFTILRNTKIIGTSPIGGEVWQIGGPNQTISWVANGTTGFGYFLDYSTNGGLSYVTVASNYSGLATGNNTYNWTIPNTPTTHAVFRIRDRNDNCINYISPEFTLANPVPYITVSSPVAAETLYNQNSYTISWSNAYLSGTLVKIEYSTDNGTTWANVITATTTGTTSGQYTWAVPAGINTSTARFRLSDFVNPSTTVTSAAFSILNPFITLSTPNGGQIWTGCDTRTLTVNGSGTTGPYKYELTTDDGSTWTTISSGNLSSWSWLVTNPAATTTQARIRVTDNSGKAASADESNANFTILPNTQLISNAPSAGTSWTVGTTQTISWVASGTSGNFTLYYSTNAGTNWTLISSSYFGSSTGNNSYSWTLPNTPTTQAQIQIIDRNNSCIRTYSPIFTIAGPTPYINLTYPTAGSVLYNQNTYYVSWDNAYLAGTIVKVELSTDGGTTYSVLANATSTGTGNGSYTWNIPVGFVTNNAVLRVTDFLNNATVGISGVFSVANPGISVVTANGGESWTGCINNNLRVSASGTSGPYKWELSTDDGSTWTTIISSTSSTTTSWQVTNRPTTQARVRVTDLSAKAPSDISDNAFTIIRNSQLIITSPSGGEVWQIGGSVQPIIWVVNNTSGNFAIDYSTNGGTSWLAITSSYFGSSTGNNSYNWTIPNTPTTNAVVRVYDRSTTCILYQSPTFTISAPVPFISIQGPVAGNTLYNQNSYSIYWNNGYLSGSLVKIEYSTNNGANWVVISTATATNSTNGSFTWSIPANFTAPQAYIRVSDFANPSTSDTTGPITISNPSLTMTSPNGGEVYTGCDNRTITFSPRGTTGNYTIAFSADSGLSWSNLATSSGSSFTVSIPNKPTTKALMRVTDNSGLAAPDISNATFTVLANRQLVITSPVNGDAWQVGTGVKNINWVSSATSGSFIIEYSTNNGTSWILISSSVFGNSTGNNSYAWTVPNTPTSQAKIRITDRSTTCITTTGETFVIQAPDPVISISSPTAGDMLYFNQSTYIYWTSTYVTATVVNLDYSSNGGTTWQRIALSANSSSNSYLWTVPAVETDRGFIRVSDPNNASISNIAGPFTISPPKIKLVTPVGGEVFMGCVAQTYTFTQGGTSQAYKMELSTNGGTTWTTQSANFSSTNFSFALPNFTSVITNALIRISDYNNPATFAVTDYITLVPNNQVIISSPGNGDTLTVGNTININWINNASLTGFRVDYSTNGGASYNLLGTTSGTTYPFTVPNSPTTNGIIRVRDNNNNCVQSISNVIIAQPVPKITVTSPNTTSDVLYGLSVNTIYWTSQYLTSPFVAIEYSLDAGSTWQSVTTATSNSGSYNWSVPANYTNAAVIRISEFGNPALFDVSNNTFSISPPIVITEPNGDEIIGGCTVTTIQWKAGGNSGTYVLEYSNDNGSTWITVVSAYSAASTGTCSYNWTAPNDPTLKGKFRVSDYYTPTHTAINTGNFSITPTITLLDPKTGGWLIANQPYTIKWTAQSVSNLYNIEYSTNGGTTWIVIVGNQSIPGNQYTWTVPNISTTNALVRVTDAINTCKRDVSSRSFTISSLSSTLNLTAPTGTSSWASCTNQDITWTSSAGVSGRYTIEYSINGGTNWNAIVTDQTISSNTYSWTIPSLSTSKAVVRVRDAVNALITTQNAVMFAITGPVANAGADDTVCAGQPKVLSGGTSTGTNLTYSWSPTTGLSNAGIANPTATPTATTTYTLTVRDANGCTSTDAMTLIIAPFPTMTINSPAAICPGGSTVLTATGAQSYSWSPSTGLSGTTTASVTANPAVTTTYTVSGYSAGCMSIKNVTVTVNPAVTAAASSGVTSLCAGASTTLSAPSNRPDATFTWSPATGLSNANIAAPTATPTTTTTYTVTASSGGCIAKSTVTISVNTKPTISISPGTASICAGGSVTLKASGATSYTWSPSAGLNTNTGLTVVASPAVTTTYTVTGTQNGCSSTDTVVVTVNPA
ncbi:MAG: Ser-Thr-rich GPI-anchored membrane family protein, partial [Bacteroidota bacterium]